MANLGEITELVANKQLYLEVGADQYIGIESMRPIRQVFDEVIHDTSGATIPDMVGEAEEWLLVTLKHTAPEYASFHTSSTAAATGIMTTTDFKIIAISTSGSTETITVPGYVINIDGPIKQPGQKYATDELFIRITGGFTIS